MSENKRKKLIEKIFGTTLISRGWRLFAAMGAAVVLLVLSAGLTSDYQAARYQAHGIRGDSRRLADFIRHTPSLVERLKRELGRTKSSAKRADINRLIASSLRDSEKAGASIRELQIGALKARKKIPPLFILMVLSWVLFGLALLWALGTVGFPLRDALKGTFNLGARSRRLADQCRRILFGTTQQVRARRFLLAVGAFGLLLFGGAVLSESYEKTRHEAEMQEARWKKGEYYLRASRRKVEHLKQASAESARERAKIKPYLEKGLQEIEKTRAAVAVARPAAIAARKQVAPLMALLVLARLLLLLAGLSLIGNAGLYFRDAPKGTFKPGARVRRLADHCGLFLAFVFAAIALLPLVMSATIFIFPHLSFFQPGQRSGQAVLLITALLAAGAATLGNWREKTARKGLQPVWALLPPLLVMGLVSAAAMWASHRILHARFEAVVVDMQVQGIPTRMEDLLDDVPPEKNAHPKLTEVLDAMDSAAYYQRVNQARDVGRWSPRTLTEARSLLADHKKFLNRALPRAMKNATHWQQRTKAQMRGNPLNVPTPKLADGIFTSKLLAMAAVERAASGDPAGAWRYHRTQLKLVGLTATSESLIGQMVAVAMEKIAAKTVVNVLLNVPSARIPADLAAAAARLSEQEMVRRGLGSEVAWRLDVARWLDSGRWFESGARRDYEHESLFLAKMGVFDLTAAYIIPTYFDDGKINLKLPVWPYLYVLMSAADFSNLWAKEREADAWTRIASVASKLNVRRAGTGSYPQRLGVKGPWVYKRLGGGKDYALSHKDYEDVAYTSLPAASN